MQIFFVRNADLKDRRCACCRALEPGRRISPLDPWESHRAPLSLFPTPATPAVSAAAPPNFHRPGASRHHQV